MTSRKEIITVAVGQCGNQLSRAFWEQKINNAKEIENDDVLFKKYWTGTKARAILVDTEPRVINGTLRSAQGEYFDEEVQILKRSSGAGNNFAHGHHGYGNHFCDTIVELFRYQLEACDCPESVLFMHSLGGGTGSGLGTRTIAEIADYAPKLNRVAASILSATSAREVITSPYNELLSLKQLSDHASVILPIDNNKLAGLLQSASKSSRFGWPDDRVSSSDSNKAEDGYRSMNNTLVQVLSDLTTSSSLSEGEQDSFLFHLQKHLTTPDRRFLTTSTTASSSNPASKYSQYAPIGTKDNEISRKLFATILERRSTLLSHRDDIRTYPFSSTLFMCRGAGPEGYSAYEASMDRWKSKLDFAPSETSISLGFVKGQEDADSAMSCFSNSSAIAETFQTIHDDSSKLYKKKAMLHHYLRYCEEDIFEEAFTCLQKNIERYSELQRASTSKKPSQNTAVVEAETRNIHRSSRPLNGRGKSVVTQQYVRKY